VLERVDVAVVGAGPAGLAAALVLAEHGVDVCVLDEQVRPGGQIYRQPPDTFEVPHWLKGKEYAAGRELVARAESLPRRQATTVWGVFGTHAGLDEYASTDGADVGDDLVLALAGPDGLSRLRAARILLAPGAYDLPVAFPGWTLPGVMAAGGVQAFVKSQQLLPGRRFVLTGAHPLLLVIAEQLLNAGADVAAVAFAQPRPGFVEAMRMLPRLRGHLGRVVDVARPARRLRDRLLFGHVVVRAEGTGGVERAVLARVDRDWRVVQDTERAVKCDTVALGYGFVPSSELARQAGCTHRWVPAAGGWVAEHDEWFRSSEPRIYVAGELTGVAGAEQAVEEGRVAAAGILRDFGRRADADRMRLASLRRFSAVVQEQFAPRLDALAALATDDTLVCRCEEITAGALRRALHENPHLATADAVKLLTRTGMGPCQGRFCMLTVAHLTAAARARPVADIGTYAARPPIKPIPLAALAARCDDESV
jgi:thioredoxin reductase